VAEKFLGPLDAALQVANGGHATEFDADRFIVCATSAKRRPGPQQLPSSDRFSRLHKVISDFRIYCLHAGDIHYHHLRAIGANGT
jgi:hypothetical protein